MMMINKSIFRANKKKRKFIHHFQWKKRKRKFNQLQVLNVMLLLLLKLKFFKNKKKPGTKIKPEITRTQKNQFFSFRLLAWVVKLDKNSFVFLSLSSCVWYFVFHQFCFCVWTKIDLEFWRWWYLVFLIRLRNKKEKNKMNNQEFINKQTSHFYNWIVINTHTRELNSGNVWKKQQTCFNFGLFSFILIQRKFTGNCWE